MPQAQTPEPPYYAVIFTNQRVADPAADAAYSHTADEMERLAREQPGYLGFESATGADGLTISVSYWTSLEAIAAWRAQVDHAEAQRRGRAEWYASYAVRVCRVERASSFERKG